MCNKGCAEDCAGGYAEGTWREVQIMYEGMY